MNTKKKRSRIAWGWLAGLTAAASCLFLAQLAGQTPPAQAPAAPAAEASQQAGATIKAESRLVLVDAVVDPLALALPSHVPFHTVKGYTLSVAKQVLNGKMDVLIKTLERNVGVL